MSRFIIPDTTTITLANGDTLTVWTRLNAGQTNRRYARMYTTDDDGKRRVDLLQINRATVLAYLVDWHLDGDDMPIKGLDADALSAVLDNLDPDDYIEIRDAIDAHEQAQQAKKDAEKKTRNGAPRSLAI